MSKEEGKRDKESGQGGIFPTEDGRGRFVPAEYVEAAELQNVDVLNEGMLRYL